MFNLIFFSFNFLRRNDDDDENDHDHIEHTDPIHRFEEERSK